MTELRIAGLAKHYGPVTALTGVAFTVPAGSRTAVIGPSGSGKTTLLRLIAGFERPDAGEIVLGGTRVSDPMSLVPPHRLNVGLVMQEGALFPHLSVGENIAFGIGGRGEAGARIPELMTLVELDPQLALRHPHQLSGGQQQRVALARALARKPRLMLLDEPFSALDAGLREQMRQTAGRILSEAGITTLLVTHDCDEAMTFADRLIVLREGRLIQEGPPRELYLAPADALTAEFLGAAIVLDAELGAGQARTALGALPVDDASLAGSAKVMLRPEQLRLAADASHPTEGRVRARVLALQEVGASARITLRVDGTSTGAAAPLELSFTQDNRDLPSVGDTVSIAIAGKAHCFPS